MKKFIKILAISFVCIFTFSLVALAEGTTADGNSASSKKSSSTVKKEPVYQKSLYVNLKQNTEWDGGAPISNMGDFDYATIQITSKPKHAQTFFKSGQNTIVYKPEKNYTGSDTIGWSWSANGKTISGNIYITVKSSGSSSSAKSAATVSSKKSASSKGSSAVTASSSDVSSSSAASSSSSSATASSAAAGDTKLPAGQIAIFVITGVLAAICVLFCILAIRNRMRRKK